METAEFNLKEGVARWRDRLVASMSVSREVADELEAHLMDSVAASKSRGLTTEEAFHVAVGRLGSDRSLASEFAKVCPEALWRVRGGWMLAGVVGYMLALGLSQVASTLGFVLAGLFGMGGVAAGWTGVVAQWVVLGLVGGAFYRLLRGGWALREETGKGWLRRPLMLGGSLMILLAGMKAVSAAGSLLLARQSGPERLGQVYLVSAWGQAVCGLLAWAALCVALTWVVRSSIRGASRAAMLLLVCLGVLGVGQPSADAQPAGDPTRAAKPGETATLSNAMSLWKAGKKEEAVVLFEAIDFRRRPLFPAGVPLGYTEAQFVKLPSAAREKIHADILAQVRTLKEIAAQVRDRGLAAQQGGKAAEAEKHFGALRACGEALESKDSLALLQMVGRAMRKLGAGG